MIATIVGAACPLTFLVAALVVIVLIRRENNRSQP